MRFKLNSTGLHKIFYTLTVSRVCTVSGNNASVALQYSGSNTLSRDLNNVSFSFSTTKTGSETRLWTPPSGSINCGGSAPNQYATIDWANFTNGLKLNVDVERTIQRSKSMTRNNVTRTFAEQVQVDGTREITFSRPPSVMANSTIIKSITSQLTRTKTFTRWNGRSGSQTSTITVSSSAPLTVTEERDGAQALVSKTVAGVMLVTENDSSVSSCEFENVVYDLQSTNKCLPVSGAIYCEKKASASGDVIATTIIRFGQSTASTVSIQTGDDPAAAEDYPDYNAKGCDFE